jgi:hypothetical protein
MEDNISALYVDAQGNLCINFGTTPMYVSGFGESVFGEYLIYEPKKNS